VLRSAAAASNMSSDMSIKEKTWFY
jgi:hypothetical protein